MPSPIPEDSVPGTFTIGRGCPDGQRAVSPVAGGSARPSQGRSSKSTVSIFKARRWRSAHCQRASSAMAFRSSEGGTSPWESSSRTLEPWGSRSLAAGRRGCARGKCATVALARGAAWGSSERESSSAVP